MNNQGTTSLLKSLRTLTPIRDCTFDEALSVAERQATRLGELVAKSDPTADGIDLRHIGSLPRIQIVFDGRRGNARLLHREHRRNADWHAAARDHEFDCGVLQREPGE